MGKRVTPPQTPQAFVRSLKDRAANAAKIVGVPAAELVDRYYHRRLLARVFEADPDGWVLKGGQALLVRWPGARYSVDVDLLRTGRDATVDSAVEALVAATSVDLDDHLTYSHYDTSREMSAGRPTRKVRFEVRFGLRQLTMVSVDVVATDHRPLGELVDDQLEAPFTVEAKPWPMVRIWPMEDHIADKIAAMYERHRTALLPSTRFKDLVDLMVIAHNATPSGELTHAALHAEVRRRRHAGGHVPLPAAFEIPDPSWVGGYSTQAAKVHDLPPDCRTLAGAMPLADAFITPLMQDRPPPGRWTPDELRWR